MIWRGVPVGALVLVTLSLLMLGPAGLALAEGDGRSARVFAQSAGVVAGLALLYALANARAPSREPARSELLGVVFVFAAAPAAAALPTLLLAPWLGPVGAYFEMVSMMTTTGATALPRLEDAPRALHLWRGATAWFGGFAALTAAAAIFAPRNLGGYEVRIAERFGQVGRLGGGPAWAAAPGEAGRSASDGGARVARAVVVVAPVYLALTAALGVGLVASGMGGLRATITAMGVMSTSGVSLDGAPFAGAGGTAAEGLAAAFLVLAASRHAYADRRAPERLRRWRSDPELELAVIAVGVGAGWILLKHLSVAGDDDALRAAWAALFTCLSFLTTTGYVATGWPGDGSLTGHGYPGMILLGLATMGGGVASTAGGVKLLRAYALYQHGVRDLDRLSQPYATPRQGEGARRVGFGGAVLAWLFLMLFALGVGATTLALALNGVRLDQSFAAAIATMANTGPAYAAALGPEAMGFAEMPALAKGALCVAMVLGRMEVLAAVALANPDYWRR
jgi:trk system potassium uptake protein TrkH